MISYEVAVTIGKSLDVLGLKGTSLSEIRQYAHFLAQTASALYALPLRTRTLAACPCCQIDVTTIPEYFQVYGAGYKRCPQCGHLFVYLQPTEEALKEVFTESEEHSATYTDRDSLEIRLTQVTQPKLEWVKQVYCQVYGHAPDKLLDVGAGGGHFVETCRRAGLNATGYEISKTSRAFARNVFGIELCDIDFLNCQDTATRFEVITFWGLLEYISEPGQFIQAARQQIDPQKGMLIIEVPRFDCLGSAVQVTCPTTIARHLDPTSHVNCFSDASLATLLYHAGFRPVAAWYFGMDIYELLVQLALKLDHPEVLTACAELIPALQHSLDAAQFCDDIILACVPISHA